MVVKFLDSYLIYLKKLIRGDKNRNFIGIDTYLSEKKIPEQERVKDIFFKYLSLDNYTDKTFIEIIEVFYKNEIVGLNFEDAIFTPSFHKEIEAYISGKIEKIGYYSNAYELLFLFSLNRVLNNCLIDDLSILENEIRDKSGGFIYFDNSIINVVEGLLRGKGDYFLGIYIIKNFLEGLEKVYKTKSDRIDKFFTEIASEQRYFCEVFDELLVDSSKVNSKKILDIYSVIHRHIRVNKIIIRDFKIEKVR